MTAPTRTAGWHSAANLTAASVTTTSFTMSVGDIFVAGVALDGNAAVPAVPTSTAGSITWTVATSSKFASYGTVALWTGTVTAAGSGTVTVKGSASFTWSAFVQQIAGGSSVGAAAVAHASTGTPSVSLTTGAANSFVVVTESDFNAVTGAATWGSVNGTAITSEADLRVAADYSSHFGYLTDAGAAGANSYGMSAPAGQAWNIGVVEIQGPSATDYTSSPGDAVGLTDSLAAVQDNVRTQGDSLGLTDAVAAVAGYARAQADNAGITDALAVSKDAVRAQADSMGIADAVTVVQAQFEAQADAVGLTDAVAAVQGNVRAQADTVGLTDSLLVQKGKMVALDDPVGLTDAASAVQDAVRATVDGVGVADSLSIAQDKAITQSDPLGLTDGLTAAVDAVRAEADTVGLADSLLAQLGKAIAQADAVGLADTLTDKIDAARPPADTAGLTDTLAVSLGYVRAQADAAGITDAVLTVLGIGRVQGDAVGITDHMVAVLVRNSFDRDITLSAVPLPTRWTISELLPRWAVQAIADTRYSVAAYVPTMTTTELPTRWATALNPGETMSVDIIVTAGAVKYVGGTITETTGKDISADPFVMSLGSDKNPGTDWVAPDASVAGATNNIRTLKLLVSASLPAGITVPGTYWVWAKVTDAPEVEPMRLQGPITVR